MTWEIEPVRLVDTKHGDYITFHKGGFFWHSKGERKLADGESLEINTHIRSFTPSEVRAFLENLIKLIPN